MLDNFHQTQSPIKSKILSHKDNKYTLEIEPLMPGFGYTLGNSIRRVLLSSVPGFAVTKIRINDLTHEYQAIKGVVEDALDITLNLKQVRSVITTDDETVSLILKKDSAGVVTANDFEEDARVKIINKDQHICTLDKGSKIEIEIEISRGIGYLSIDDIDFSANTNPNQVIVDSLFSPVSNVSLNVEKVRVGENTNFDKVAIDFQTDGTVEAKEIIDYSLNLIIDRFTKIQSSFLGEDKTEEKAPAKENAADVVKEKESDLNLPKRIKNILEKNDILTKDELKKRIKEVQDFPGITEKALKTITEYIK